MKVSLALGATTALAAVAALAAVPAFADCSYPAAPDHLPDGNTATIQEMVDGQKTVKADNDRMNANLNCLKREHDDAVTKLAPAAGAKQTDDEKKAMDDRKKAMDAIEIQKHNAAIDQLQSVADRFNEQVRVFKKKAADSGGD